MAHRPMLINLNGDDLTLAGSIYVHNSPGMAVGLSGGSRHRVHGYRASVDLPGLQASRNRTYESANAACLMLSDATDVVITQGICRCLWFVGLFWQKTCDSACVGCSTVLRR